MPKLDLVAAVVVPAQNGTLQAAAGLPLWPKLREELLNFRMKINPVTAHASYEHWRESDTDDLVFAAALATWGATRFRLGTPPSAQSLEAISGPSYWSGAGGHSGGIHIGSAGGRSGWRIG